MLSNITGPNPDSEQTMSTRTTYGLYGNLLPLFTTLLGILVFAGIQAYYGGKELSINELRVNFGLLSPIY